MTYILDTEFVNDNDGEDASVSKKQKVRDKLQRDVDKFIANGGQIQQVEAITHDELKNDFEQLQKSGELSERRYDNS